MMAGRKESASTIIEDRREEGESFVKRFVTLGAESENQKSKPL
jgi:hypothetical protein